MVKASDNRSGGNMGQEFLPEERHNFYIPSNSAHLLAVPATKPGEVSLSRRTAEALEGSQGDLPRKFHDLNGD
jgi:hypothetical protein